MRITESQLRQIIRQEVRALTEMPHNPERSAWRGRSYRKGGQLVRNLRAAEHLRGAGRAGDALSHEEVDAAWAEHDKAVAAQGLPVDLELGREPLDDVEVFKFEQDAYRHLEALDDALQDIPEYRGSWVDGVEDLKGDSDKAILLRALWRNLYGPGLAPT